LLAMSGNNEGLNQLTHSSVTARSPSYGIN
jgi:hypothetical protein